MIWNNPEYVKKMMDAGVPLLIVDIRTPEEYRSGHIPGAVSISLAELEQRAVREIPDTGRVIIYCDCDKPTIAKTFAMLFNQGIGSIMYLFMDGGFARWRKLNYPIVK